jgi:hypothetical protein
MSGKRQRTTFAKNQRERARMDKAAEKRARRQQRRQETDPADPGAESYDDDRLTPLVDQDGVASE